MPARVHPAHEAELRRRIQVLCAKIDALYRELDEGNDVPKPTPHSPAYYEIDPDMIDWRDTEGDGSYLLATIDLGGALHHLEALAVHRDAEGLQVGFTPIQNQQLNDYDRAFGGSGSFHETTIGGREYLVFMSPYR